MYFDTNFKLLPGKNTQKVNKQNIRIHKIGWNYLPIPREVPENETAYSKGDPGGGLVHTLYVPREVLEEDQYMLYWNLLNQLIYQRQKQS